MITSDAQLQVVLRLAIAHAIDDVYGRTMHKDLRHGIRRADGKEKE